MLRRKSIDTGKVRFVFREFPLDLLIEERARERLKAHSTSERLAITAKTVASILGTSRT